MDWITSSLVLLKYERDLMVNGVDENQFSTQIQRWPLFQIEKSTLELIWTVMWINMVIRINVV